MSIPHAGNRYPHQWNGKTLVGSQSSQGFRSWQSASKTPQRVSKPTHSNTLHNLSILQPVNSPWWVAKIQCHAHIKELRPWCISKLPPSILDVNVLEGEGAHYQFTDHATSRSEPDTRHSPAWIMEKTFMWNETTSQCKSLCEIPRQQHQNRCHSAEFCKGIW